MTSEMHLAGVLPVIQMPYQLDESIDWETLHREIDWLYECGADGLVIAMVSEVLRLDQNERREVVRFVAEKSNGRGPVVASVGAESSVLAERATRGAEADGATAVMAIPPISVAVSEEELTTYYARILNATDLPVIVQDASGYVGRPLSIDVQAQLLKQFGAAKVYFKPEATPIGPRLSSLRDATGGEARIFEGTGGIALVDSFRRGIVGTMPGSDLIRGIVSLWNALRDGDDERVYQLSLPISSLIAIQNSLDAFLAIEKYLLVKQGVFRNTVVRGPVGYALDSETRGEIDRLYDLLVSVLDS